MAKMTLNDRKLLIDGLVENELIEAEDRDSLEGLSDVALLNFGQALIANESDDEDGDEADDDEVDNDDVYAGDDEDEDAPAQNSAGGHTCNKCGGAMKKKKKSSSEEDEEMTGNQGQMSAADWLSQAPAEVQEMLLNARQISVKAKAEVIQKLTANLGKDVQKSEAKRLATLGLNELQNQLKLAESFAVNARPASSQRKNYSAASGGSPINNSRSKDKVEGSEPLIPPTINWKEVVDDLDAVGR